MDIYKNEVKKSFKCKALLATGVGGKEPKTDGSYYFKLYDNNKDAVNKSQEFTQKSSHHYSQSQRIYFG